MYISLWENYRGHPDNISFMQFSTKIDGFEQKDSQGFENSYNSYEQYPLEKFFIFTIYQNYTLALKHACFILKLKDFFFFNGRKQTLVDTIGILSALRMRGLHDKPHLLAKLRIAGSENLREASVISYMNNLFTMFFSDW